MLDSTPLLRGAREALGIPAATLAAGYIGFGALAAGYGLPLSGVLLSTVVLWAMPAQLILVEMQATNATLVALVLSVALSSARFLPMTVSVVPMLIHERHRVWHYFLLAQVLSITSWTMAMVRFPAMPVAQRMPWMLGFAGVCLTAASIATVAGYLVADALTPIAKLGLVFIAPMYYLLVMLLGARERLAAFAIAGGAVAGPLAWMISADWSVLAGGLLGGTLAYAADRQLRNLRRG